MSTLPEYESVAQVAVDLTDSQRQLAERAILDGMQQVLDAQPPPQKGNKPTLRSIDLHEFFTICETFYDTTPEIKVVVLRYIYCYFYSFFACIICLQYVRSHCMVTLLGMLYLYH